MKNEENKKEIKIYKKQNSNQENKKSIDNNYKKNNSNNIPEEKSFKNIKNINENKKIPNNKNSKNNKNNESNIYNVSDAKIYNNNSNYEEILKNLNINNINAGAGANQQKNDIKKNNNDNNEPDNSFESKMFYEVNSKNILNFNTPVKTINVYRNNFFNYTNNNLLSNLLCDISDENKNVMVSELDLNISNSQSQTIQPEQPAPQRKVLEKKNTEVDFRSQLESNIIKILEKNIVSNSNNKNKNKKQIKNDKKCASYKNTDENKIKNINIKNNNIKGKK